MSRTTTSSQRPWAIWADFDDDGEPTDRTIIGDSDGRAVFCTVEATPGEIAEAARLMPGDRRRGRPGRRGSLRWARTPADGNPSTLAASADESPETNGNACSSFGR